MGRAFAVAVATLYYVQQGSALALGYPVWKSKPAVAERDGIIS